MEDNSIDKCFECLNYSPIQSVGEQQAIPNCKIYGTLYHLNIFWENKIRNLAFKKCRKKESYKSI